MKNFRTAVPIRFSAILHKTHFSSGSSEKTSHELLKQVQDVVEDKVKSEKLRNLLPYIHQGNTELIPNTSTNGNQPEVCKETDQSNVPELSEKLAYETQTDKITSCETGTGSNVGPELNGPFQDPQDPPKSLPVLIVAKSKTPTQDMTNVTLSRTEDLTNVTLPLSLHAGDKKSLLVDAVVQDIKHVYSKTSTAVDVYYSAARTQGKTLYTSVEEIANRPGVVQDFMRERVDKMNAIAVQGPNKLDLFALDTEKIMKEVNKIIETIKNMIKKLFKSEAKATGSKENKKEEKPEKKEEKPEKKEEKK